LEWIAIKAMINMRVRCHLTVVLERIL
jgi:hypothetical protein